MLIVKPMPANEYTRIGYLTDDAGIILQLFARPSLTARDRFNYYVTSSDQQPVRLVLSHRGQSCDSDGGCAELYDGDQLHLAEYGSKSFRVRLYAKETVRYDPSV